MVIGLLALLALLSVENVLNKYVGKKGVEVKKEGLEQFIAAF
jgi:hypothetical protein